MAGRPVLLLLLLLLAATPRSARACPGSPGPAPVSPGPAERGLRLVGGLSGWARGSLSGSRTAVSPGPPPPQAAAAALGALLRSLRRPGRAPGSAALSPRRWGWGPQGSPQARLSPRSWDPPVAPFWTMATPQRFGRRR
uniref:pro-FMRFamide-related neuropeptide FF n=1 Tax=Lonchura striata TaxID=40157 RepID=UPI000B4CB001|nr:pro-FMRFamide-related neuropeptide FF [Lonchura striata domestica]